MVSYFYSMGGWFFTTPFASPKDFIFITNLDYVFLSLAAICVCFGTWLLYTANSQKYYYRIYGKDYKVNGEPAQTVGGRLLASGVMGYGRKMNYAGDILVYFGLALTTGFDSFYPYIIFFLVATFLFTRAK